MSEFSEQDVITWLELALKKGCSIDKAIYYSVFWQAQTDEKKFTRAMNYFLGKMSDALKHTFHNPMEQ